jgi:sulfur-carrier protein
MRVKEGRMREAGTERAAPVVVTLPAALVRLFPGALRRVELSASSVGEAIDGLEARWPGMRDRLCDSTPRIRRHINVFVEGERASLKTRLAPGAEVHVLTAITGG